MSIYNFFDQLLNLSSAQANLTLGQMITRAVLVYILSILVMRIGKRRFWAKSSIFDTVLVLIFGTVVGNAIIGRSDFLITISTGFFLILLHSFLSFLTFYSRWMGFLFKGDAIVLIKDGKIQHANLWKSQITQHDLLSALRQAHVLDPAQVQLAVLERGGEISVVPFMPQ